MAFHEGCAAYAVSLNASATMSMDGMTMDMGSTTVTGAMSMTGMPTATGTASANDAGAAHKHSNTGPIVGGVVGGILGLLLIVVGGWLGWRYLKSKNDTNATPYQGGSNDHGGDQMAQHVATPYYGPGAGDVKSSAYFNPAAQTPQQHPTDLMSSRLSYASTQPYPYSPAVTSPQGPFTGSASQDYDTSMFAALPPASRISAPPSQFGNNSTSSGDASQGPLMVHGTGQTWTTNPITPPPPFQPSSSPGLPPGAKSPETKKSLPSGYTSGIPEAMSVESERR